MAREGGRERGAGVRGEGEGGPVWCKNGGVGGGVLVQEGGRGGD